MVANYSQTIESDNPVRTPPAIPFPPIPDVSRLVGGGGRPFLSSQLLTPPSYPFPFLKTELAPEACPRLTDIQRLCDENDLAAFFISGRTSHAPGASRSKPGAKSAPPYHIHAPG